MRPRLNEAQTGFTLLEIVTVLSIVGILFLLALPKFFSMQDAARLKTLQGAIAELNTQVISCYIKNIIEGKGVGGYSGYDGDLGPYLALTGQTTDMPASGTIKVKDHPAVYDLVWKPSSSPGIPGYFCLGAKH